MSRAESTASATSVIEQTHPSGRIPAARVAWDIRQVAHRLGRTPSQTEYDAHGEYVARTAQARFGRWLLAIEAAGLEITPIQRRGENANTFTESDVARAIRRAWRKHERPPTAKEAADCRRDGRTINLKDKCWDEMLAAAGVPTKRETVADAIRELWNDRHSWQDFLRFGAADIAATTGLHVSRIGHIIRDLRDSEDFDDLRLAVAESGGKSNARVWEARQ